MDDVLLLRPLEQTLYNAYFQQTPTGGSKDWVQAIRADHQRLRFYPVFAN